MASLEGRIYVLNWFMNRYRDEAKKLKRDNENLSESILISRDLSQITTGYNGFDTDYGYALKYADINNEVDYILSREYCFSLTQIYEMTESYLLNIITEFLFRNQQHLITLKLLSTNILLSKGALRELVKDKLGRKNNRKLIGAIRKLSNFYVQHETNNTHKINLSSWFDLLSEVRHTIIHNRLIVSDGLIKYLANKEKTKLFEYYFDRRKTYDGVVIFLSNHKFALNNQLLNEFVYFVFRSLSIDNKLDPTYVRVT